MTAKQRATLAMQADAKRIGIPIGVPVNPPYRKPLLSAPAGRSRASRFYCYDRTEELISCLLFSLVFFFFAENRFSD